MGKLRLAAPRRAPSVPTPDLLQRSLLSATSKTNGQSLDPNTQATMNARFGHDFSSVRIHTDSEAAASASALGAAAFTQGNDIAFGGGLQPGDPASDPLLAHELTHVVQQARHGSGDPGRVSAPQDAAEQEADALGARAAAGRRVQVNAAPTAGVSCSFLGKIKGGLSGAVHGIENEAEQGFHAASGAVSHAAQSVGQTVAHTASNAGHSLANIALGDEHLASEGVQIVGQTASNGVHNAEHAVSSAAHNVGHNALSLGHKAGHAISSTAHDTGHTISHAAHIGTNLVTRGLHESEHLALGAMNSPVTDVVAEKLSAVGEAKHGNRYLKGMTPVVGHVGDGIGLAQELYGTVEEKNPVQQKLDAIGLLADSEAAASKFAEKSPVAGPAGAIAGAANIAGDFYDAATDKDPLQRGLGAAKGISDVFGTMGGVGGFSLAESGSLGAGTALSAGGAVGLGALGAVGGAAVGGVEAGLYLNNDTSVGDRIGQLSEKWGVEQKMKDSANAPWWKQAINGVEEVGITTGASVVGTGWGALDMIRGKSRADVEAENKST